MTSQNQIFSAHATAPANDQLNDLDTIARRLKISIKTLRRMLARGDIGYHQVGFLKRISDSQYLEYLARIRRCRDR
jgi:excisionase family DNA binding protein